MTERVVPVIYTKSPSRKKRADEIGVDWIDRPSDGNTMEGNVFLRKRESPAAWQIGRALGKSNFYAGQITLDTNLFVIDKDGRPSRRINVRSVKGNAGAHIWGAINDGGHMMVGTSVVGIGDDDEVIAKVVQEDFKLRKLKIDAIRQILIGQDRQEVGGLRLQDSHEDLIDKRMPPDKLTRVQEIASGLPLPELFAVMDAIQVGEVTTALELRKTVNQEKVIEELGGISEAYAKQSKWVVKRPMLNSAVFESEKPEAEISLRKAANSLQNSVPEAFELYEAVMAGKSELEISQELSDVAVFILEAAIFAQIGSTDETHVMGQILDFIKNSENGLVNELPDSLGGSFFQGSAESMVMGAAYLMSNNIGYKDSWPSPNQENLLQLVALTLETVIRYAAVKNFDLGKCLIDKINTNTGHYPQSIFNAEKSPFVSGGDALSFCRLARYAINGDGRTYLSEYWELFKQDFDVVADNGRNWIVGDSLNGLSWGRENELKTWAKGVCNRILGDSKMAHEHDLAKNLLLSMKA